MAAIGTLGTITCAENTTGLSGVLPANKHIQTSSVKISVPVTWSGVDLDPGAFISYVVQVYKVSDNSLFNTLYMNNYPSGASGSYTDFIIVNMPNLQFAGSSVVGPSLVDGVSYKFVVTARLYKTVGTYDTPLATATLNYTFTYYTYAAPAVSSFVVQRCLTDGTLSDDGTYVKATVVFSISSLGSGNTKSLLIYRKLKADSSWTLDTTCSISAYSGTWGATKLALTYAVTSSYDLKAVLADKLNTISNLKEVLYASATMDVDTVNKKVAIGKKVVSGGPGFDVGSSSIFRDTVEFEKAPTFDLGGLFNAAPTFASATVIAALMAAIKPYCKLSFPSGDVMTYNASKYCWVFSFNGAERNDGDLFTLLLGGANSDRKMGWVIPRAGKYRVTLKLRTTGASASTGIVSYIAKFPSGWTPPAANYLAEASMIAASNLYDICLASAWSSSQAWLEHTFEFTAAAGEKIWPTAFMYSASATIDNGQSWASIEQIG
jgi:hypothetical protein